MQTGRADYKANPVCCQFLLPLPLSVKLQRVLIAAPRAVIQLHIGPEQEGAPADRCQRVAKPGAVALPPAGIERGMEVIDD